MPAPSPTHERLQRILADAGVASRRACEKLIEEGRVEVNGKIVQSLPAFADPATDRIRVDGQPIRPRGSGSARRRPDPDAPTSRRGRAHAAAREGEADTDRHIYIMLNKPAKTLTTAADEPGMDRRTVVDLVQHPSGQRLFPVGRLDYETTGLLLMTSDGDLANRLTHPRYEAPKTYRVLARGDLTEAKLEQLRKGLFLTIRKRGGAAGAARATPEAVRIVRRERDKTLLEITLTEGRNREIRRLLAGVDLNVRKLERVAVGPVRLKGVARGAWRELDRREVQALRRAVGLDRSARA
jgi:23S rRNA pseudouridine2605 synthase